MSAKSRHKSGVPNNESFLQNKVNRPNVMTNQTLYRIGTSIAIPHTACPDKMAVCCHSDEVNHCKLYMPCVVKNIIKTALLGGGGGIGR